MYIYFFMHRVCIAIYRMSADVFLLNIVCLQLRDEFYRFQFFETPVKSWDVIL